MPLIREPAANSGVLPIRRRRELRQGEKGTDELQKITDEKESGAENSLIICVVLARFGYRLYWFILPAADVPVVVETVDEASGVSCSEGDEDVHNLEKKDDAVGSSQSRGQSKLAFLDWGFEGVDPHVSQATKGIEADRASTQCQVSPSSGLESVRLCELKV